MTPTVPSTPVVEYRGADAATPFTVTLDAADGHVLSSAPEGDSLPLTACLELQNQRPPEPVVRGVATLHVCHPNVSPPITVDNPKKSEPNRAWHDDSNRILDRKDTVTI